ncbi:MAG: fimbrial protein, partial [Bacteroidales bacterium]
MGNIFKILLLSITLLMFGCSDLYENDSENESEKAVRIMLSLNDMKPESKSIDNKLEDENIINSVQIFIFRRSGEQPIVENYYFNKWSGNEVINAYTGRFRYVIIANQPKIDNVQNYSDISSLIYKCDSEEKLVINKSLVAVFDKELLVPYPPTPDAIVQLKDGDKNIQLVRLAAKIEFSLLIDDITLPDNRGKLRDRLRIHTIQLKRASKGMYIFRPNTPVDQNTTETMDYPVRTIPINQDRTQAIPEHYYILERIPQDTVQATYAEITAEYSDLNNATPTKKIFYRVKVEEKSGRNFKVVRNTSYRMNIRIQGVNPDDIHVDVEDIHAGYVFVDDNVIGRKTGATWEDAFNTISEALAFSKVYNDTIKNANKKIKFVYVKEG